MVHRFRILISDRNRRVRQYLAREMKTLGYSIVDIGGVEELWPLLAQENDIDLIIFDPEIVRGNPGEAFRRIQKIKPELPVIIHTFGEELPAGLTPLSWPHLVLKSGPSAERLKEAVDELLCRSYPERYEKTDSADDPKAETT